MNQRDRIVTLAKSFGFQHVRFTPVGEAAHFEAFSDWVENGLHGTMHYMERGMDIRRDPRVRLPKARTALVLAMEYDHLRPPRPSGLYGKVAAYAWGRDYHNLIGKRLKKFKRTLDEAGIACWGGVDTAPILERSWATQAGLGFNGKNGVQILPAHGSFMFLSVLFLSIDTDAGPTLRDHCGSCTRCLSACPTDAFQSPHVLDSRRCIAYWTIENRGVIPTPLRAKLGDWVFGCDDCQTVCPHNVSAPETAEEDFRPRNAWLDLIELLETPDERLMERFLGTPLRRPGASALKRNACLALGNLGDSSAIPTLMAAADGSSELVTEHARWALERLGA